MVTNTVQEILHEEIRHRNQQIDVLVDILRAVRTILHELCHGLV